MQGVARTVGIGLQSFEDIRENDCFYVDKTKFIKEWWESKDSVTLIARPRRFGKTLTMSMTEQFFSLKYAGRGELFEGLSIWEDEKYRKLQGTYPVISLSFANVKENGYEKVRYRICQILRDLYVQNYFLLDGDLLTSGEKDYFNRISETMNEEDATMSLHYLSSFLSRYYNKKVIILLDEYDTPMQEAYVNGYWEELASFTRSLFNSTFKTNPYLNRAIMTGITRVSRESIFSDLNNLKVVTTTSDEYADCFGFTETEVFAALDEFGMSDKKQEVKRWYDGFVFGSQPDIYNPWSIINYLDTGKVRTYWANSSSNSLIGKLIREGSKEVKQRLEDLMRGGTFRTEIDEQIVYGELNTKRNSLWSLLLASGYLKAEQVEFEEKTGRWYHTLALTNREVHMMFENMIRNWFSEREENYNDFIKALLEDDIKSMNYYMNKVALATFSSFDTGNKPSKEAEPERFYHGFVLGLLVDLSDRYTVTSNRESGFGRYDVMLEPKQGDDGMILEFKVQDIEEEKELSDTVQAALQQIERKKYETVLMEKGVPREKIRKYGFAFCGKKVLIGTEK
ncbi:MAG: AAA family ATPase [Lachnospiraceae bacterium]|nr:AAA family ATPase [Lachnospiraceae bacterium]